MEKKPWLAFIGALLLACGSFTYSLFRGAGERSDVCRVVATLASIEESKALEERPRTEQFEKQSKDRLGLTQEDFDKLVAETREIQKDRANKLSVLAHKSC